MKKHSLFLATRTLSIIVYISLISFQAYSSPVQQCDLMLINTQPLSVPFVLALLAFLFLLLFAILQYFKLRTTLRELKSVKAINENAEHMNKLMTSVLSHEIRSPLNSFHFITSSLLEHIRGNDGNIRPEDIILLEELNSSFQATEESAENYLVWCQVNTNQIDCKRKPLLLSQVVNEQVEKLNEDVIRHNHHMSVDVRSDLSINSDPDLVKIMIRNILYLAIRGRNKHIEVKLLPENQNNIHLTLKYSVHPLSKTHLSLDAVFNDNTRYKPELPGEIGIDLIASLCRVLGYKVQYSHHGNEEKLVIIFVD